MAFFFFFFPRLKEAQENIKKITADKRVETKKINANSLVRTDLYTAEKWNFLKASLSGLAPKSIYWALPFLSVPANRKRGCGRRKPACPPAEWNDTAEEEMGSGVKSDGEIQNFARLSSSASATCLNRSKPSSGQTQTTGSYSSHCRVSAPLTLLDPPPPATPPHSPHTPPTVLSSFFLSAEQIRSWACSKDAWLTQLKWWES